MFLIRRALAPDGGHVQGTTKPVWTDAAWVDWCSELCDDRRMSKQMFLLVSRDSSYRGAHGRNMRYARCDQHCYWGVIMKMEVLSSVRVGTIRM